jgi:glyoxylase-like metal-dependent hydrolase (beta-lactamase superfamily II)
MELFKGVNQIKVPLPGPNAGNANVYILEGTSGNLMIDTGWNTTESFNTLAQEMKSSGFAMKDITHIAITHMHPSHFGLAGKIAELVGAKVLISDIEYNLLDSRYTHPEGLLEQMSTFFKFNGVPDWELKMLTEASLSLRSSVYALPKAEMLKPGDRIPMDPFQLQVVLTPGHAKGHLCFYEPNKKYLFTGDQILAETIPVICYHPQSGENPIGEYVTSLNTISELDVRFVFPGHGSVFSGIGPKIDDILHLHKDRIMKIQQTMGVETKSGYDLAKDLPWLVDGEPVNYDKLEPIDKRQAVLETLAYLQYLVAENKGKKMSEAEKVTYWSGE